MYAICEPFLQFVLNFCPFAKALCTEAALNAIQRRYPQIYKSDDRLLLNPETIGVQARDFMISVKSMLLSF